MALQNAISQGAFADNLRIGEGAGDSIISAAGCVFIGKDAGNATTSATSSVIIGREAGQLLNATQTVLIGSRAGKSGGGALSVMVGNATGQNIGSSNQENTLVGYAVNSVGIGGLRNTMMGRSAGSSTASGGNDNVFLGINAGFGNTGGHSNILIGAGAAQTPTGGLRNVMIGYQAGFSGTTSPNDNVFVGFQAGRNVTIGDRNVLLGYEAGRNIASGNDNIFIGKGTEGVADGDESIAIGNAAIVTANNQLVIGSNSSAGEINDAYIGSGVTKVSPADVTWQCAGGSGTDNAASSLTIAGGKNTGNSVVGGDVTISTPDAGATGTTLQTLSAKMTVKADSGNVGIGQASPTAKLVIVEATDAHIRMESDSGNATPTEGDMWRESDSLRYYDGTDEINLLETYKTIWVDPSSMVPRTTNGAAAATEEYATNDIMSEHFLFDSVTEEVVQFKMSMPDDWDLGAMKMKVYWDAAAGASAADLVSWKVAAVAVSNDDPIDVSVGPSTGMDDVVIAVGDLHVGPASGGFTPQGTPVLEDLIIFEIARNVAGNDNMVEDAKLLGVAIQYKKKTGTVAVW